MVQWLDSLAPSSVPCFPSARIQARKKEHGAWPWRLCFFFFSVLPLAGFWVRAPTETADLTFVSLRLLAPVEHPNSDAVLASRLRHGAWASRRPFPARTLASTFLSAEAEAAKRRAAAATCKQAEGAAGIRAAAGPVAACGRAVNKTFSHHPRCPTETHTAWVRPPTDVK